MSHTNIDYNNPLPEYEGLKFFVDAFNVRRRIQQIMPIFYEEQPLTWKLYEREVSAFMLKRKKDVRVLDVGCGSGFWGLLLKHKFPTTTVLCLDKNPIAIERTRYNALLNNIEIQLIEGNYSINQFDFSSFDLIILTAPYHLYDPKDSEQIPWFARGGDYGLEEFYSQSKIAYRHLKPEGMILFNQMSAGKELPDFVDFYKNCFGRGRLEYTNILKPTSTKAFLEELYKPLNSEYLQVFAANMPVLFYTSGTYYKSSEVFQAHENTSSKNKVLSKMRENWQTRVNLHRQINLF